MTKKNIQKWVEALESGKYKQGRKCLQTDTGRYCCLGVGCVVFVSEKKLRFFTINEKQKRLAGYTPTAQENAPNWLKRIDVEIDAVQ